MVNYVSVKHRALPDLVGIKLVQFIAYQVKGVYYFIDISFGLSN